MITVDRLRPDTFSFTLDHLVSVRVRSDAGEIILLNQCSLKGEDAKGGLSLDRRLARIRLLATDLDGTFTNKDGSVAPETMLAWVSWHDAGGLLAIVTGRPLAELTTLMARWKHPASLLLPDALICEERDVYLAWGDNWRLLPDAFRNLENEKRLLPRAEAVAQQLLQQAATAGIAAIRSAHQQEIERGYVELWYPGKREAELGCRAADQILAQEHLFMVPVRNGQLLALRHPLSRKGFALMHLAQHLSLAPEQVIAVGNSYNDLTMLDGTLGFLGATVADADPVVAFTVTANAGLLLPTGRSLGVGHLLSLISTADAS